MQSRNAAIAEGGPVDDFPAWMLGGEPAAPVPVNA
jgi:hypothetical protein